MCEVDREGNEKMRKTDRCNIERQNKRRSGILVIFHPSMIMMIITGIAMPQTLFWWLAPASAPCMIVVGIIGSLYTFLLPGVAALLWSKVGLRRSAGVGLVSCILEVVVIVVCGILLAAGVSSRSASFALIMVGLAGLLILIPLIANVLAEDKRGDYNMHRYGRVSERMHREE